MVPPFLGATKVGQLWATNAAWPGEQAVGNWVLVTIYIYRHMHQICSEFVFRDSVDVGNNFDEL